ncbi:MAG: Ig-like domain-containing protein, partial [Gemmatimonadaceae bacterium]
MRAAFFAVAAAFLPIVACSDDRPAEPTNPVAISASVFGAASRGLPYQLRLGEIDAPWAVGDSRQLHVIVTFSGGSANVSGGLTWSSSNSSVLRVTSGGQATAVANGSATVSAKTPGGKHVEGTITVGAGAASGGGSSGGEPPDPGGGGGGGGGGTSGSGDSGGQQEGTTPQNTVGGVTVNPTEASLRPGDTGDLDATVWDAWGNPMSGRTPTWTSSNTNVVTVTSSGGLSAKGLGTATITAAAGSHSAQANITVSQSTVAPSPQGGAPQGG